MTNIAETMAESIGIQPNQKAGFIMAHKKALALAVIVSAVAFWLALRNVPIRELLSYFQGIDYLWLIPAAPLIVVSFALRAVRWRIIVGAITPIPFFSAFNPLMTGFMMNCVLPGRVGEIARPLLLRHKENVAFSTGLATVATERLLDMLFLIAAFSFILGRIDLSSVETVQFHHLQLNQDTLNEVARGMVRLSVVLVAGVLMLMSRAVRDRLRGWMIALPAWLPFLSASRKQAVTARVMVPLAGFMDRFSVGFDLIKSPGRLFSTAGLTVAIWCIQAFSYQVFSYGCPNIDLTYFQMFVVMVVICFSIALPSVPGFWGLWEAAGVFSMSIFGIAAADAAGYTLTNHALQIFPVIVVGLISAMLCGFSIRSLRAMEK